MNNTNINSAERYEFNIKLLNPYNNYNGYTNQKRKLYNFLRNMTIRMNVEMPDTIVFNENTIFSDIKTYLDKILEKYVEITQTDITISKQLGLSYTIIKTMFYDTASKTNKDFYETLLNILNIISIARVNLANTVNIESKSVLETILKLENINALIYPFITSERMYTAHEDFIKTSFSAASNNELHPQFEESILIIAYLYKMSKLKLNNRRINNNEQSNFINKNTRKNNILTISEENYLTFIKCLLRKFIINFDVMMLSKSNAEQKILTNLFVCKSIPFITKLVRFVIFEIDVSDIVDFKKFLIPFWHYNLQYNNVEQLGDVRLSVNGILSQYSIVPRTISKEHISSNRIYFNPIKCEYCIKDATQGYLNVKSYLEKLFEYQINVNKIFNHIKNVKLNDNFKPNLFNVFKCITTNDMNYRCKYERINKKQEIYSFEFKHFDENDNGLDLNEVKNYITEIENTYNDKIDLPKLYQIYGKISGIIAIPSEDLF